MFSILGEKWRVSCVWCRTVVLINVTTSVKVSPVFLFPSFFFFHFCACWCARNEPMFEENRWQRLIIFCSQLVVKCLIMRATLSGCLLPFIVFYISFSVNLCFCPPSNWSQDQGISVTPLEPRPHTKARTPLSLSAHSSVWNRLQGTFLILFDFFSRHACLHVNTRIRNIWTLSSVAVKPSPHCFLSSGLLDNVTVLIGIAHGGKAIAGVINQPFYNYQVSESVWEPVKPPIILNVRSARRRSRFGEDYMGNVGIGSLWISAAGSSGWQTHHHHHTFPQQQGGNGLRGGHGASWGRQGGRCWKQGELDIQRSFWTARKMQPNVSQHVCAGHPACGRTSVGLRLRQSRL